MPPSKVKVFQRKDGSLIFFVDIHPASRSETVQRFADAICNAKGPFDKVFMATNCDFQFFNITDDQLKEMEIKPEQPAYPK